MVQCGISVVAQRTLRGATVAVSMKLQSMSSAFVHIRMQCAYVVCVGLLWCARVSVLCMFVRAYCTGGALQQIITFCSSTVPIIGTLQFAQAMDGWV